jgi:hypothetical protein
MVYLVGLGFGVCAGYASSDGQRRERGDYSHIRMEAKRDALESVLKKRAEANENAEQEGSESPAVAQDFEGGYPQKSPQSGILEGHQSTYQNRKSLILNGGRGRNRTYNLSVKSHAPYLHPYCYRFL